MRFIDHRTNWKFIAIVVFFSLLAVGGILLLRTTPASFKTIPSDNSQTLEGRVRFEALEGGCWYLQVPSDPSPLEDIAKFELFGVSEEELEQHRDQRVQVKGRFREDMVSICQIGTIFEVQQISPTEKDNKQSTVDTSTWQTYRNEEFGFEVKYPSHWKLEQGYDGRRYSGKDGFFQFSAEEEIGIGGIDDVSKYEAYFDMPYGSKPVIENLKIESQEARLILPSEDQSKDMKNRAALVIRYPKPVVIQENTYYYLLLWADRDYIRQILSTFRFVEQEKS